MRGPNMSYCAFENTLAAMRQVMDMLREAIDNGEPLDFSSAEEKRAYEWMAQGEADELVQLLEDYGHMVEEVEAAEGGEE